MQVRLNCKEKKAQTSIYLGTATTVSGANQQALDLFDYDGEFLAEEFEEASVLWGRKTLFVK